MPLVGQSLMACSAALGGWMNARGASCDLQHFLQHAAAMYNGKQVSQNPPTLQTIFLDTHVCAHSSSLRLLSDEGMHATRTTLYNVPFLLPEGAERLHHGLSERRLWCRCAAGIDRAKPCMLRRRGPRLGTTADPPNHTTEKLFLRGYC